MGVGGVTPDPSHLSLLLASAASAMKAGADPHQAICDDAWGP